MKVKITNSTPIKKGAEAWKVTIEFISDLPVTNRLIKQYYVWVTGEYLEDKAEMSADPKSAGEFALSVAKRRYIESGKQVPIENGIAFSNKGGEEIVDPRDYTHPVETGKNETK